MVKNIFILLFICLAIDVMAFEGHEFKSKEQGLKGQDTSAYQTQRLRINALLAERSAKFGQYDQSLNSRTGIFGLQTKKDIRNSNEILRQIVLDDNNIFKELKTLMEYKDLEVTAVKTSADQTNDRIDNYKVAIKSLQDKNEQLSTELKSIKKGKSLLNIFNVLLIFTMVAITLFFVNKLKRKSAN